MAIQMQMMCRGKLEPYEQPHFEQLIPVDTNEPTSYIGMWDVSATANDSVRAYYLTDSYGDRELHFYGYGKMKDNSYSGGGSSFEYGAPYASTARYIRRIYVHDGITQVGVYTYGAWHGDNITTCELHLSDTVRCIRYYAFRYPGLNSVSLGAGLRKIEDSSIGVYSNSTIINFPPSVSSIASMAVVGPSSISSLGWLNANTPSGGYKVVGDGALLWGRPSGTTWTVPEGVKSATFAGWANIANVTSVVLPSTLRALVDFAFSSFSFAQFKVPQGCTFMGARIFDRNEHLQKVWIPRSVTKMGAYQFLNSTNANLEAYCEIDSSDVPEGWHPYWNWKTTSGSTVPVVWNTSEAAFDAM